MPDAYLTIDDSPSHDTDRLVDFLVERGVPAVLYVRGAFMEDDVNLNKIVRAIEKGFLISNHSYAHDRTSMVGFAEQTAQISKTQALIDRAYMAANEKQEIKSVRFPHIDRGTAAHIIDFDTLAPEYRPYVQKMFWEGLNVQNLAPPTPEQMKLKNDMQDWLVQNGFEKLPTPDVTLPWFVDSELATAIDAMYTFSTSDWMLTPRHAGKCLYKTLDDLKQKIDDDIWLNTENSAHIILAHDDREDSFDVTTALIDHLLERDFNFKPIQR